VYKIVAVLCNPLYKHRKNAKEKSGDSFVEAQEQKSVTLNRSQLILCILLALLLIAGGIYLGIRFFGSHSSPSNDGNFVIYGGSEDQSTSTSSNDITFLGYPDHHIPAGQKEVSIPMINKEGNPSYFKFELVLEDTDEVLYTSDWVEPGQTISHQTLSRGLENGEYPAILRVSTVSFDENRTPMTGGNIKTLLIVE